VRKNHFIPISHTTDLQLDDPLIGRVVGGFLVVGVLGSGGFGNVHHVLQLPLRSRPLQGALKRLRPPGTSATAAKSHQLLIERFESEADALASLSHPNIVRLLKTGLEGDVPFLVLELVTDAETLERTLDDHRQHGLTLPEADIIAIVDQLLNALEAAHDKGIIHRDVKPGNLMLQRVAGYDIFVRVLDFGLAKFIAESSDTQRVMGTLDYMAPEQLRGRDIGPWTDLYALGLLLLAMTTGRPAFSAERAVLINEKLDPAYDPVARATVDREFDAARLMFLRKAISHDHRQRHQSVAAFRKAFHDAFATSLRRERKLVPTRDLVSMQAESPRPRAGNRGGQLLHLKTGPRVPDTRPAVDLGPEQAGGAAIQKAFAPAGNGGRPLSPQSPKSWFSPDASPVATPNAPTEIIRADLLPSANTITPSTRPRDPSPEPQPAPAAPYRFEAPRQSVTDTGDAIAAQTRWPLIADVAKRRSTNERGASKATIKSFFDASPSPTRVGVRTTPPPPRAVQNWLDEATLPGDVAQSTATGAGPSQAPVVSPEAAAAPATHQVGAGGAAMTAANEGGPGANSPRMRRRPYEPPSVRETEGKLASLAAIANTEDSGPSQ
jgi:serine/threonine-protein kinase